MMSNDTNDKEKTVNEMAEVGGIEIDPEEPSTTPPENVDPQREIEELRTLGIEIDQPEEDDREE